MKRSFSILENVLVIIHTAKIIASQDFINALLRADSISTSLFVRISTENMYVVHLTNGC